MPGRLENGEVLFLKFLMRLVSIVFIVMGLVHGALGSAVLYGLQQSEVTARLALQMDYDPAKVRYAAILLVGAGVLLLLAGLFGFQYAKGRPELFPACAVLGGLVLAMRVVLVTHDGVGWATTLAAVLALLWMACEVLFLVLAILARRQIKAAPLPRPPGGETPAGK